MNTSPISNRIPAMVLVTADTTIEDDGGPTFDTIKVIEMLEVGGYVKCNLRGQIRLVTPLESFDRGIRLVTLLGIEFALSFASFEDDQDNSLTAPEFFDRLVAGTFIRTKENDSNGIFDQAELEN
jgi:hypothetical protein